MAKKRRKTDRTQNSGQRADFEVILAPDAVEDLRKLRAYERSQVYEALETHLRHQPTQTSRIRIKRLRGLLKPQYRLRVGDEIRVLYDIAGNRVEILAILAKRDVEEWLKREGVWQ
jgi:mRNA-degrading endonuclease RelE of RelBE toxin-antitoxin system